MLDLDRQTVNPITRLVHCPIRAREVAVERCEECPRLVESDRHDPPRYMVCEARRLVGWLGMDDVE